MISDIGDRSLGTLCEESLTLYVSIDLIFAFSTDCGLTVN